MKTFSLLLVFTLSLVACDQRMDTSLPILGEPSIDDNGDLVHYKAPSFSFTDQLNQHVSNEDYDGKVHVVDFFFSTCPTICPVMTGHLRLVQDHFEKEDRLGIISYSIDPKHDTPEQLAAYADRYGVDGSKWALLTGYETDVFELAKDYKVRAFDDSMGGQSNILHDGTFVLIDDQRRIRGYYNGLEKTDVSRLIGDIEQLLKTM
ncbi:MAG: SCO family protein [Bacteroidota bacterium]